MNIRYLGLALILTLAADSNVSADCWFGCDSIIRDISTDYARLIEMSVREGFSENKRHEDRNIKNFCKTNERHELELIRLVRDSENSLISVSFSQLVPPKIGADQWTLTAVNSMMPINTMKLLNFGVSGMLHSVSEDKRCNGFTFEGGGLLIVCAYGDKYDLPISLDTLQKDKLRTGAFASNVLHLGNNAPATGMMLYYCQ